MSCAATWLDAGIDPQSLNSVESADDLPVVLSALGYEQAVLWGHSYGTVLAQRVAERHPEVVAGLILEGVSGPMHHRVLMILVPTWPGWDNSPIGGTRFVRPMLRAQLFTPKVLMRGMTCLTLLSSEEDGDFPITDDFALTGEIIGAWIGNGLAFYEGMLAFVETVHAINATAAGDTEALQQMLGRWGAGDATLGGQNYRDFVLGILSADGPAFEVSNTVKNCFDFPGALADEDCAPLGDQAYADDLSAFNLQTDIPTLFLQGALDTQTPPELAEAWKGQFSNLADATLGACVGHFIHRDGGACSAAAVNGWLADPSAPIDTACAATACAAKPLLSGM